MKSIALSCLLLALLAVMNAHAAEGFFRPIPANSEAPEALATTVLPKNDPCSLMIRYNPDTVANNLIHVVYAGGGECYGWWRQAVYGAPAPAAAPPVRKVSNGPAVAPEPVFACAVTINFSPATAATPIVMYTGTGACVDTRWVALAKGRAAVDEMCLVESTPCR